MLIAPPLTLMTPRTAVAALGYGLSWYLMFPFRTFGNRRKELTHQRLRDSGERAGFHALLAHRWQTSSQETL
jgi:hypothetical protein